jgi:hypothetical protein
VITRLAGQRFEYHAHRGIERANALTSEIRGHLEVEPIESRFQGRPFGQEIAQASFAVRLSVTDDLPAVPIGSSFEYDWYTSGWTPAGSVQDMRGDCAHRCRGLDCTRTLHVARGTWHVNISAQTRPQLLELLAQAMQFVVQAVAPGRHAAEISALRRLLQLGCRVVGRPFGKQAR